VIRGSRPIDNDWDDMFVVNIGQGVQFFGHPDYFHDPVTRQPLGVTDTMSTGLKFCPPLPETLPPPLVLQPTCPDFAFSKAFRDTLTVQPAFAEVTFHGSSNMFDFSRTQAFGFQGDIFISQTGALPLGTGATTLDGYDVRRVDRQTGQVSPFIFHACTDNTTACRAIVFEPEGLNRPIDVHFRGPEMFIVDFGVAVQSAGCAPGVLACGGGKIWKVAR